MISKYSTTIDMPPFSIYRHKLRWTNSEAISGCDCVYIIMIQPVRIT